MAKLQHKSICVVIKIQDVLTSTALSLAEASRCIISSPAMGPRLNLIFLHTSPRLLRLDARTKSSGSEAAPKKAFNRRFLYLGVTSPSSLVKRTRASPILVRTSTALSPRSLRSYTLTIHKNE